MRRAGALRLRALILGCLAPGLLYGCGGHGGSGGASQPLTFEQLADTAGLSDGPPIVQRLDVERMTGGALRVRGHVRLPEGTRVQVAIKAPGEPNSRAMTQAIVSGQVFESPPMMERAGPLPVARYRFEISAQFTPGWQSGGVLRATQDGRALRGPGITRTRSGGAMFWMVEEATR